MVEIPSVLDNHNATKMRRETPYLRHGMPLLAVVLLGWLSACVPLGAHTEAATVVASAKPPTTYYVDCDAGDDAQSGTATRTAWRTLTRTNQARLLPGDRLLLRRGCTWLGPLNLPWSGKLAQPILVGSYGIGPLPVIQNAEANVDIRGSYLIIEQLMVRADAPAYEQNCNNQPVGWRMGFVFEAGAHHNTLHFAEATELTHGVLIKGGSHHNAVLHNRLYNNTLMFLLDADDPGNDSGAVGIALKGDDNEIAYNELTGHDACSYDFGRDGSAVEVYGGRRNNIHHNVATDNNTFTELGNKRSADNQYAYNRVTATIPDAHFLVTRGRGSRWGPVANTRAYNNTVYLANPRSEAVDCDGGCGPNILTLTNNIIWAQGVIGHSDQAFAEGHNLFWKTDGAPQLAFPKLGSVGPTSQVADPQFVNVQAFDLHLRKSSPAIGAGTRDAVLAGYTTDLMNVAVPEQGGVSLGAYEYVPTAQTNQGNPR